MCPTNNSLSNTNKFNYFFSTVLDVFIAAVSVLAVLTLERYFLLYAEVSFFCVWIFLILLFGYKYYKRQFFVTTLFSMFFASSSFIIEPRSYFIMSIYLTLIMSVSLIVYLSSRANRYAHNKFNKEYMLVKEELSSLKVNSKRVKTDISSHELEMDMMASIYEITKKMVGAGSLDDIINLSTSFFNRNFSFNCYVMFQYDNKNNDYSILFSRGISTGVWAKMKFMLLENPWLIDEKNNINIKITDNEWNSIGHNMPYNVRSFVTLPLVVYNDVLIGAFLCSSEIEYFKDYIIKYLKVFSTQMSLGIEKVKLYEEVQEQSRKDSLTGLFNRTYWEERFDIELKKARRYSSSLGVLMIDIDFFKKYNDKYGHLVGDEVLKEVSKILLESIYSTDIIGRYGGEEFVIAMPMIKKEEVLIKAERIREKIEGKKFFPEGIHGLAEEKITISIGVSFFPDDNASKLGLLQAADKALYSAKQTGRNKVIDYINLESSSKVKVIKKS
jgi:diguanylate cyclase (GGDEF)-like protein